MGLLSLGGIDNLVQRRVLDQLRRAAVVVDELCHLGWRDDRPSDLVELLLFQNTRNKSGLQAFLFPRHCVRVRLNKETVVKGGGFRLLHLVLLRPGEHVDLLLL